MGLLLLLPFPLFSPLSAFFLHIAAVVFGFFCSAPFLFCQCRFFFLCQYDFLMGDFYLADKVKENLNLLCAARPFSLGLVDKDFFEELNIDARLQQLLSVLAEKLSGAVIPLLGGILTVVPNAFLGIFIVIISSYYMATDFTRINRFLLSLFPRKLRAGHEEGLWRRQADGVQAAEGVFADHRHHICAAFRRVPAAGRQICVSHRAADGVRRHPARAGDGHGAGAVVGMAVRGRGIPPAPSDCWCCI